MRRNSLLISLLMVFSCQLFAQVPGFMGKKFGLSYAAQFFVAFDAEDGMANLKTIPVYKHSVMADYTFGRNLVLSLSAASMSGQVAFEERTIYVLSSFDSLGDPGPHTFTPHQLVHKTYAYFIDLGGRYYFGKFIAPVGYYHHFRLGWLTYGLKEGNFVEGYQIPEYSAQNAYPENATWYGQKMYSGNRFSYGLGRRQILTKNLFLDYSFAYNLWFGKELTGEFFTDNPNNQDIIYVFGSRMIRKANRVDINLGIGYLIF